MDYVPENMPASRPGIKTLLIVIAAIALFVVIQFWAPLKASVGL
jgi:hypothetical protein